MSGMALNYSNYCPNQSLLRLTATDTDDFVLRYLFPPLFLLGIVGNFFNLSILCSKEMRNRANDLLAAVSFSDFSFFIAMLPHSLATHLDKNLLYRKMYLPRKLLLSALVNWMSASAIWFIFAVTFERYLVVRSPLHARIYWKTEKLLCTLVFIFASTLLLTVYHLWEYDCQIVHFCNYTQVQIFCTAPKNSHTDANEFVRFYYIQASKICSVVFVVFLPILAVFFLTLMLIRQLHLNDMLVLNDLPIRRTVNTQHAQRKRITSTVVLISICFATTQGPSAVLSLLEFFTSDPAKLKIIYKLMGIANALVIVGKTINFILFCSVSAHFRARCLAICFQKFPTLGNIEMERRRGSLVNQYSNRALPYTWPNRCSRNDSIEQGRNRQSFDLLEPLEEEAPTISTVK